MTPYGRSLSHNLWFEKNCPICLCSPVLELPHWRCDTSQSHMNILVIKTSAGQFLFALYCPGYTTPVQDLCNGNSISLSRSYYLVPRFFFRSWHRCTEREGFIIKISHSGCTILYQVSNINFTELWGSHTTILTTDNVKGMQEIYLKNQKTPCPKRPYNYMIHLIKVNNHYSMTKLWTTLVVGGVSDIVCIVFIHEY